MYVPNTVMNTTMIVITTAPPTPHAITIAIIGNSVASVLLPITLTIIQLKGLLL